MPGNRALHRGRRPGRERAHRRTGGSDQGPAQHADRRRVRRHRDAVFVRHDRSAQGDPAVAAGSAAAPATAAVRFPAKSLALSRGHDLSLAGAALSFGAAGRGQSDRPHRRHRHHHGEIRSRVLPRAGREVGRHPQPAGADHVLAPAEAAGRGAPSLRPLDAGDRDPRRRALPGAGQGRHDQMVGADHPRILWRDRRARLHRLQQRGMARPSRHRRQGAARRSPYP